MEHNVFISWSGTRGQNLANALYEFIPDVVAGVRPWVSFKDIAKGRRWNPEISRALKTAKVGIVCLTPESIHSDWVLFETGALATSSDEACVCTYLFDVETTQLTSPLADFQRTMAEKSDTLELIKIINGALPNPVDIGRLERLFEHAWPKLESRIQKLRTEDPHEHLPKRTQEDILSEILERVRNLPGSIRTILKNVNVASATLNFGLIPFKGSVERVISLTGVTPHHAILVTPPISVPTAFYWQAVVRSNHAVTVRVTNIGETELVLEEGIWRIMAIEP